MKLWDHINADNWKTEYSAKAKAHFGDKLTDDALVAVDGNRDRFVAKLQECCGVSAEEASRQTDEWYMKATK